MDKFIEQGQNIQTITTDNLISEYENMIKEHQKYLYDEIISTIQKHIEGLSTIMIESLIDRFLLDDLKFRGRETINELNKELTTNIEEIIKESENKNKTELLKEYQDNTKLTLRRNQIECNNGLISQLSEEIIKKIKLYAIPFKEISDENLNRTITEIDKKLEIIMKNYQEKFKEEYNILYDSFKEENKRQITDLITKIELFNKKTESLQMYSAIIELSNYNMIQEDNKYYAEDKFTKEKIELTFNEGMLISKNKKIRYRVDSENKRAGFYNNETKVTILLHNGLITLIPPKKENELKENVISFEKKRVKKGNIIENKYFFYYNIKPVNDNRLLKSVIEQIEKYSPSIYTKLIADKDFNQLMDKIKENAKPTNTNLEGTETKQNVRTLK